jgi:hypothetical protein
MKYLTLKTDDVHWAVAFAGAAVSVSRELRMSVVSENPVVQELAQCLGGNKQTGDVIEIPTDFTPYDEFQARRTRMEMDEIHGIAMDTLDVISLQYAQLAQNVLVKDYGVMAGYGYFYPEPSAKRIRAYSGHNVLCQKREYLGYAQDFLLGYDPTQELHPVFFDELEDIELVMTAASFQIPEPTVVVMDLDHWLNYIFRAWYQGFDNLWKQTVILGVIPDHLDMSNARMLTQWPQVLAIPPEATSEQTTARGNAWRTRVDCKFDNHEYWKRIAQGLYK